MSEENSKLCCDACHREIQGAAALRCDYCHASDSQWCSRECRAGLGWSMHEAACNVVKSDTLPATPYAWQNVVANAEGAWESQEEPFPAFLVQSRISAQFEMTQTVLPAVVKPKTAPSQEMARVKPHEYTFSINKDSGIRLSAPDDMISSQSRQATARMLAESRTPRPKGHTYWISSKQLVGKLQPDAINTFSIVRNGSERSVSCFVDGEASDTFYEQVYDKLGYGLKQFLGSQYKSKGLGSNAKRTFSTHYAINPETGDSVTFTLGEELQLVDVEMFLTKDPKPARLQTQTFSLVPRENDPEDIQALCMAIEDQLDTLHDTNLSAEELALRGQWETHLQVLLDHFERLETHDSETIQSDVAGVLEIRNTIHEVQRMLQQQQPIAAESTQELVDRLLTYTPGQIKKELDSAVENLRRRRLELAKSSDKQRRARWTKFFAAVKRKTRVAGTKNAEKELRKFLNAFAIVLKNSKWTDADRIFLVLEHRKAENFLEIGDYEKDVTTTNAELLPERKRVIELKSKPIEAFYKPNPSTDDIVFYPLRLTEKDKAIYQNVRRAMGKDQDPDLKEATGFKSNMSYLSQDEKKHVWKREGDIYKRDTKTRNYDSVPVKGRNVLYPDGRPVAGKGKEEEEDRDLLQRAVDQMSDALANYPDNPTADDFNQINRFYIQLLNSLPERLRRDFTDVFKDEMNALTRKQTEREKKAGKMLSFEEGKRKLEKAFANWKNGTHTRSEFMNKAEMIVNSGADESVAERLHDLANEMIDEFDKPRSRMEEVPLEKGKEEEEGSWSRPWTWNWNRLFGKAPTKEQEKLIKIVEKAPETKRKGIWEYIFGEGEKIKDPEEREKFVLSELKREARELQALREAHEGSRNYPWPSGFVPSKGPTRASGQRNYYYGYDDRNYYYGKDEEEDNEDYFF